VRKAKRTAFNVAHPINTAENALLNAATPSRRSGRISRASSPTAAPVARDPRETSVVDPARYVTDPSRRHTFRIADPTDEEVYVVLVAGGDRRREVADFMRRYPASFGPWRLDGPKIRRRAIRKQLAAPPVFLLSKVAPAELGHLMTAAYAELGATVQLWAEDATANGGPTSGEPSIEHPSPEPARFDSANEDHQVRVDFPPRVTTAWLNREVPVMPSASFQDLLELLASRGWTEDEIKERVLPLRAT
jgi:hypothetical protein